MEEGVLAEGVIDWQKRYDNMQQHTGEHIFSGLVHKHFGYDNVGFHMGTDEVTVDFNGVLTQEQLDELEDEANQLIYDNVPVKVFYPSKEELEELGLPEQKRTDRSGTHCRDTRRRYLRLLWHPCGDNRGSRSDQTAYYDQL